MMKLLTLLFQFTCVSIPPISNTALFKFGYFFVKYWIAETTPFSAALFPTLAFCSGVSFMYGPRFLVFIAVSADRAHHSFYFRVCTSYQARRYNLWKWTSRIWQTVFIFTRFKIPQQRHKYAVLFTTHALSKVGVVKHCSWLKFHGFV